MHGLDGPAEFLVEGSRVLIATIISVTGEKLVSAFTSQDNLHMLSGKARNVPAGNGASH